MKINSLLAAIVILSFVSGYSFCNKEIIGGAFAGMICLALIVWFEFILNKKNIVEDIKRTK
jgi:hypothetical protein